MQPEDWQVTPAEAVTRQREMAARVVHSVDFDAERVRRIGGMDVSVRETNGRAAIVVVSLPELETVAEATASGLISFPYVPGLLSFREIPLALAALEKLPEKPEVLMVDGQGIAHPRRFGIACHIGVLTDLPTIGVAKSVLSGRHQPLGDEPGAREPLLHRGETIGMAYRAKKRTNPLIISPGHRMDVETAVRLVERCLNGYRLPEPTRRAHVLAGQRSDAA